MTSSKIRPCRVKGNKEKVTLSCKNCHKDFKVFQSTAEAGRKYCSILCSNADRFRTSEDYQKEQTDYLEQVEDNKILEL